MTVSATAKAKKAEVLRDVECLRCGMRFTPTENPGKGHRTAYCSPACEMDARDGRWSVRPNPSTKRKRRRCIACNRVFTSFAGEFLCPKCEV